MSQNDEAKNFLKDFLVQLGRSDETNQELSQTNRELLEVQKKLLISQGGIFEQNNQMIRALSTLSNQVGHISTQLDGLAQRVDYLYAQMGELGNILMSDGSPALPLDTYPAQVAPSPIEAAVRSFARETFNGFTQGLRPGGGRTRRG